MAVGRSENVHALERTTTRMRRGGQQTILRGTGPGAVGCGGLEEMGFVDTSECCGRCHYAERFASGLVAGPCRVALPDGQKALVCCASKKQLLERTGP